MAIQTPQQVVIVTLGGLVLRSGFCDFKNDGSFDPLTQTALTSGGAFQGEFVFDPPPPWGVWIWNGNTFVLMGTKPTVPSSDSLQSPDGSIWAIKVTDLGLLTTTKL